MFYIEAADALADVLGIVRCSDYQNNIDSVMDELGIKKTTLTGSEDNPIIKCF